MNGLAGLCGIAMKLRRQLLSPTQDDCVTSCLRNSRNPLMRMAPTQLQRTAALSAGADENCAARLLDL
jgi:hypothetical protein